MPCITLNGALGSRVLVRELEALGTDAARTLFVAGSAADVPGASALGMPIYWHNRIGMRTIGDVSPTHLERSLNPLLEIV